MRRICTIALAVSCTALAGAPSAHGAAGTITTYPIPVLTTPYGVANGPDGKIWFVDSGNHSGPGPYLGRMSTTGQISLSDLVLLPKASLGLRAALGADGNMWVLQDAWVNKVPVNAAQTSDITPYALGTGTGGFGSIVSGPDNRLWFGLNTDIGTATTGGTVGSYSVGAPGSIPGVIVGSDGKIWFGKGDAIARMSTSGVSGAGDVFPLPSGYNSPFDLAPGPDGNVWFTVASPAAIGKITPAGVMTFFPTPTASSLPFGITAGPDGHMWFVERNGDRVGSIPLTATSSADIKEYAVGGTNAGLIYIVAGPDNRMWFSMFNRNRIGAITTNKDAVVPPAPGGGGGGGGGGGDAPGPTGAAGVGTTTPAPVQSLTPLPARPTPVGCVPNRLILTDVFPGGKKTRFLGVAPAAAAGKTVEIVSSWNGKTVARVTVASDASFSGSAALPPARLRASDRARYFARMVSARSQALKFARRAYTTEVRASNRTITFAGTITKPLARPTAPITIRASSSCSAVAKGAVVGTATPSASGAFTATVTLPTELQTAPVVYLRAETKVQRTVTNKKTFPTFTLIRGIKVGA